MAEPSGFFDAGYRRNRFCFLLCALRSSFKVQFSRPRRIRHDDADGTTYLERNTLHFAR